MPMFVNRYTYGPYDGDPPGTKPTPAKYAPPEIFFDADEAGEEAYEWMMQDPTCQARSVKVPLCHHAETLE